MEDDLKISNKRCCKKKPPILKGTFVLELAKQISLLTFYFSLNPLNSLIFGEKWVIF